MGPPRRGEAALTAKRQSTMPLSRALLTLVLAALVSLALQHAASGLADESAPSAGLGVQWDYRPADLPDLVEATPAIVLAEVESVTVGDPLRGEPADGAGDPFVIPTERIGLRVVRTLDGQAPEHFVLFKLGGPGQYPDGDPAYEVGERYLLFVRPRLNDAATAPHPDGTYLAVAPDGRLEKLGGELDAEIEGPVADELDGATLPEAEQAIATAEASAE